MISRSGRCRGAPAVERYGPIGGPATETREGSHSVTHCVLGSREFFDETAAPSSHRSAGSFAMSAEGTGDRKK